MQRLSSDTPDTYRALVLDILEVLVSNRCLKSYAFDGADMLLEWEEGGFERAFGEFKLHPYSPFSWRSTPGPAGGYFAFLTVLRRDENAEVVDQYLRATVEGACRPNRQAAAASGAQ